MQRQKIPGPDEEPVKLKQRHAGRSWGELLAGWLLVLCGLAWVSLIFSFARPWAENKAVDLLLHALYLMPGVIWLLAGIATLQRFRKVAQAILIFGLPFILLAGWLYFPEDWPLTWTHAAVVLPIALSLFFLARWIGRQEDGEG